MNTVALKDAYGEETKIQQQPLKPIKNPNKPKQKGNNSFQDSKRSSEIDN